MHRRIAINTVLALWFAAGSALIAAEPPKPPARRAVRVAPPAPPEARRAAGKRVGRATRTSPAVAAVRALAEPKQITLYALEHISTEVALNAIDTLVGPTVKAAADERSNTIVVSATAEQQEAVRKLIQLLDTKPAPKAPEHEVRVFKLKDPLVPAVMDSIRNLILAGKKGESTLRTAVDPVSQAVIARGTPEELARLERFFEQYGAACEPTKPVVLQIKHRSAQEVMRLLKAITSPALRVTVDEDQQTILIVGAKGQVTSFTQMVERLDQPQPSFRLTYHFIKNAKGDDQVPPLPDGLVEPAKALAEYGFDKCALLATVAVRAQANSEFESTGGIGKEEGNMMIFVSGLARLEEPDKSAHLTVEARVIGPGGYGGGRAGRASSQGKVLFSVESTMSVPLGDHVVIAAAPSDHEGVQAIAIILRAEVDKP